MKKIFSKTIIEYLRFLTHLYLKRWKVDIIGVTGSVGKTTVTLAIHKILSKKYRTGMTYKDKHGLNSETGIPFAVLDVHIEGYSLFNWIKYLFSATYNFFTKKFKYEKYIVEMGVDKPDDMIHLLKMLQPDVGVFLSMAKVHGENFEELLKVNKNKEIIDLIFEEKAKLVESISKSGWSVLNQDDKMIYGLFKGVESRKITFGLNHKANVKGKILKVTSKCFSAEICYKGECKVLNIKKYLVNGNVLKTFLAAITVGLINDIKLDDCIKAIEDLDFPPGRMTKIEGIKKTLIIDSSYNSSKPALIEALENLNLFKNSKRIAVLGDMRELGIEEESEHREAARKAVNIADEFVLIGPAMKKYFYDEALKQGFDKSKMYTFLNTWKALDFIKDDLLKGGEVILVKGSQNTLFLEIIVEGLMGDSSEAEEILCRRGSFWKRKRLSLKDN